MEPKSLLETNPFGPHDMLDVRRALQHGKLLEHVAEMLQDDTLDQTVREYMQNKLDKDMASFQHPAVHLY